MLSGSGGDYQDVHYVASVSEANLVSHKSFVSVMQLLQQSHTLSFLGNSLHQLHKTQPFKNRDPVATEV